MPKYAYLSASASHRWLAYPPSAKLCANIADQTSEYAQQETDCHELCAYLVEKVLGIAGTDPTESLTFYDAEMQSCAKEYRNYALEQIESAKKLCQDPQVMIEQRLDFSRWVENGFGTGHYGMSNARIEATNNKIKLIIRKAYGFRNIQNMLDMVYLVCSDIRIPLPNRKLNAA